MFVIQLTLQRELVLHFGGEFAGYEVILIIAKATNNVKKINSCKEKRPQRQKLIVTCEYVEHIIPAAGAQSLRLRAGVEGAYPETTMSLLLRP